MINESQHTSEEQKKNNEQQETIGSILKDDLSEARVNHYQKRDKGSVLKYADGYDALKHGVHMNYFGRNFRKEELVKIFLGNMDMVNQALRCKRDFLASGKKIDNPTSREFPEEMESGTIRSNETVRPREEIKSGVVLDDNLKVGEILKCVENGTQITLIAPNATKVTIEHSEMTTAHNIYQSFAQPIRPIDK